MLVKQGGNVVNSKFLHTPDYSNIYAQKRIERACETLGEEALKKLFLFTNHLRGAQSADIAKILQMPLDTVNGLIKRVYRNGLPAFEDRRSKTSSFLPPREPIPEPDFLELKIDLEDLVISFNQRQLRIPRHDNLLCRSMLLMFVNNGLLSEDDVSRALGLSKERVRKLKVQLKQQGVDSLINRHKGQQKDYKTPPEVKTELLHQYILNLREGKSVSPSVLKRDMESRDIKCPGVRTIASHLRKSGLEKLDWLKKNS